MGLYSDGVAFKVDASTQFCLAYVSKADAQHFVSLVRCFLGFLYHFILELLVLSTYTSRGARM